MSGTDKSPIKWCAHCEKIIEAFQGRVIVNAGKKDEAMVHQHCLVSYSLKKAEISTIEKEDNYTNNFHMICDKCGKEILSHQKFVTAGLKNIHESCFHGKEESERITKDNYYLNIAEHVADRATCSRRNYGAIIVKNDEIISTGYTGAPRGRANCVDKGICKRQELNIPPGERYELCKSVHAEQNAIISAARERMIEGTLYLVGIQKNNGMYVAGAEPCELCKRFIINAGITRVIIRDDKEHYRVQFVGDYE